MIERSKTAAGGKRSVGFGFSGWLRLISICRWWIGGCCKFGRRWRAGRSEAGEPELGPGSFAQVGPEVRDEDRVEGHAAMIGRRRSNRYYGRTGDLPGPVFVNNDLPCMHRARRAIEWTQVQSATVQCTRLCNWSVTATSMINCYIYMEITSWFYFYVYI